MKVLLGLGNPGSRYALTRHNIGWLVLDAVAESIRAEFLPGKGEFYAATGRWRGNETMLVKPTTFMNNSGVAAEQIVKRYGVEPSNVLVIVDELQFQLGRVQIKPSGSSGGHNGLESLIRHFQGEGFPRLRCGIGAEFGPGEMVEYVLSPFREEEREEVLRMILAARDAALDWIALGTSQAMSLHNRRAGA